MYSFPRFRSTDVLFATMALIGMVSTSDAGVLNQPGQPAAAEQISAERVAPALMSHLTRGSREDFVIEFSDQADLSAAGTMSWNDRGRYVYETLKATAERSQADVRAALNADGFEVQSYWIKNVMLVRGGNLAALQTAVRFDQVARVVELPDVHLHEPESQLLATGRSGVVDNLVQVGADQVWETGTSGIGVTIGVIDIGVRYTHEAIVHQYRGNLGNGQFDHDYNWQGPSVEPATPPYYSHSTHILGTILGDNRAPDPALRERTGMAPGAQWIACHGLLDDVIEPEIPLLECGQFMLAPTRSDGSDADPDKRPQAVNNSWSEANCDGTATGFYADVIEAWVAAGIFPIFAAGNSSICMLPEPPGLSTVASPASLGTVFTIGSTGNHDGLYAPHSLWGPTADPVPDDPDYPDPMGYPQLKPQVVAPGVAIRSASAEGDSAYMVMTGTSMSAPHIAGLVALMLDAGECLTGNYAALGEIIMQTARPVPYDSGGLPAPGPGNVPNYATGWGEIDAMAAVDAAAAQCGPTGTIRGVVSDKNGAPVASAKIEIFVDELDRIYEIMTEPDGSFVRRVPIPQIGDYTVRASAYGYLPATETGVVVYADLTTAVDLVLPAAPYHRVEGHVMDAVTGWPLHARIEVSGAPLDDFWTDPISGAYSVHLPQGRNYELMVSSEIRGYVPQSVSLNDLDSSAMVDVPMLPDTVSCNAPGYGFTNTWFAEDFSAASGTTPPMGWDSSSAGLGWMFGASDDVGSPAFQVPPHGQFAAANDELGAGGGYDNDGRFDYLTLPAQNLLGLGDPVLTYRSYHDFDPGPIGGPPRPPATVEASVDGGITWTVVGEPKRTTSVDGWTNETIDLTPVMGGSVLIRFHADDLGDGGMFGTLGPGWAIDDVAIRTDCMAPATGGLVIGQIRDANTQAALNGVAVQVDGDPPVFSQNNPGYGPGFFALHIASGTLAAEPGVTLPDGYGDIQLPVTVATGQTVRQDLLLPAGRLRIYPASPTASVELGTTAMATFVASNTGTLPLTFGFEGEAVEEHFEATFPPAEWSVETTGTDCAWQWLDPNTHPNFAGGDGRAVMVNPIDCLDATGTDTSLMTAAVDLSGSATASLGFFLAFHEPGLGVTRLDIDVTDDAGDSWHTLFTQTEVTSSAGPGTLIELDLSAYAGDTVQIRFRFRSDINWSRVLIDQVHVFSTINDSAILTLAPDAGTLTPDEDATIQATFDASEFAQPGIYQLPIRIAEDTPYPFAYGDFYATMQVTAPASYGAVIGRVRGLGKCDDGATVLSGAEVTIEAAGNPVNMILTDGAGQYEYWLEAAAGPYTVTIEADGYLGQSHDVDLVAGDTFALDVDLRLLDPCLSSDPASIKAMLDEGASTDLLFDLRNDGPVASDWALRVGGDPNVLTPDLLSQNHSSDMELFTTFACISPATGFVLENRYFRVFPMADHASTREITGIRVAVDNASSSQGSQSVIARLHRLEGEFILANLTLLAEQTINVPDTQLEFFSAVFDQPISVDPAAVLVAELYVPDGTTDGNAFYPGGNTAGASGPSYYAATGCGNDEPITYENMGMGWMHLVLELDVLASAPCSAEAIAVDWLSLDPVNGTIAGDESSPITASFDATGLSAGSYQGTTCLAENSAQPDWRAIPTWIHVGGDSDRIFSDRFGIESVPVAPLTVGPRNDR